MLLRRGFTPEYVTLGWNVWGVVVLAIAAICARSVALGRVANASKPHADGPSLARVAEALGVTRSAVSKALKAQAKLRPGAGGRIRDSYEFIPPPLALTV
jgi:hypothetical protein